MTMHPANFIPKTLGPIPDDLLDQMLSEAEATALQDLCEVPGPYFRLLIAPALSELRARRAQDQPRGTRAASLSLVPDTAG